MEILIILLLILLNGFFSLSEIALVSSKETRIEQLKKEGSRRASIALELIGDSENFLSSVQVGITLIGIINGAFGGTMLAGDLAPFIGKLGASVAWSYKISLIIIVVLITYVSIVIGELVPKTVALNNPEKVAIRVAPFIKFFSKLFYPFVKILASSTKFINNILGVKEREDFITEAELRQMIRTATIEGVIEEGQNEMHEKLFHFSDKKAKHLMTHRTDVQWIDLNDPEDEILEKLHSFQHSKIVCCEDSLDEFKGVLVMRDFYKALASNSKINFTELMIKPIVVFENSSATVVLEELRQDKNHFCIVVDEYGDFEGIITLQDILENIVGYIVDEDDDMEEPDYFIREDNSVLISGEAPIEILEDFINNFEIDFEVIDYSTVAGFVINLLGRIPKIGDKVVYNTYDIEIVDMDGNRIDKILITNKEKEEVEE
ncbi:MAG: hemolysin family protein [Bacteroidales bacterium]|jgi:putative hemolysin